MTHTPRTRGRRTTTGTDPVAASLLQDDRLARRVGVVLLSVSLVLIAVSTGFMAARLSSYTRAEPPVPFAMIVANEDAFDFAGVPFALTTSDAQPPQVTVRWGDETVRLLVGGSEIPGLPTLARHADWLAVLLIAEGATEIQGLDAKIASGQIPSRLVVVARSPSPEFQQYKDHVYTYLELNPDATITRSERTYRDVVNDTTSWRHVAAMKVTGGLNSPSSRAVSPISYPNYSGVKRAMQAMGWTWPVFGAGAAGFLTGLILLLGSYVHRPDETTPAA